MGSIIFLRRLFLPLLPPAEFAPDGKAMTRIHRQRCAYCDGLIDTAGKAVVENNR